VSALTLTFNTGPHVFPGKVLVTRNGSVFDAMHSPTKIALGVSFGCKGARGMFNCELKA